MWISVILLFIFGSFVYNRVLFVGLLDLFSLLFRASSEMKINKTEKENKDTIRVQSICVYEPEIAQLGDVVDDVLFSS